MPIFNPLLDKQPSPEPSSESKQAGLESTSKILDNKIPSICPKCEGNMSIQGLDHKEQVYYCLRCRVTNPMPK